MDADVLARWFALWAVNAKHGAEALGGGRPGKRGGGGGGAGGSAAAPPIAAADVELLPDDQADKIESEGEPVMASLRLAAGLVRLGARNTAAPGRLQCQLLLFALPEGTRAAPSEMGAVFLCLRRVPHCPACRCN